jgi:hypothetical protein
MHDAPYPDVTISNDETSEYLLMQRPMFSAPSLEKKAATKSSQFHYDNEQENRIIHLGVFSEHLD